MALKDDLISVWELSEASGNALDAHSSNTLTETSGTIAATSGPAGLDGARDFEYDDGEYFALADNTDLSASDIDLTWALWIKKESDASDRDNQMCLFGKWGDGVGGGYEYSLFYVQGSYLVWQVSSTGSPGDIVAVNATNQGALSNGVWYHVVCWHDSVNNQLGISVNAGTPNTTSHSAGVADDDTTFRLGSAPGDYDWDGLIAQAALWKGRVLTSDERTELYAGGDGLPYADWDVAAGFVAFPYPRGLNAGLALVSGGVS